jgi:hypothetical protein
MVLLQLHNHHNIPVLEGLSQDHSRPKMLRASADALAHNANMLFQRKPKLHTPTSSELDVADSMLPTTATAPGGGATSTRCWNVLKPQFGWVPKLIKTRKLMETMALSVTCFHLFPVVFHPGMRSKVYRI